nr:hypothetical protein [Tanacetum cinerariifolium]
MLHVLRVEMVINSPWLLSKNWLVQKQTALGQTATSKESSNLFMAGSLPKTIVYSFLHKIYFHASTIIKKVNDVVQLRALIDGKKMVVIEDVIRSDLHLDDADGVECLPNEEIFAKLTRRNFNFCKYIFDIMVRNVDNPSKFLMYPRFIQVIINAQVDDLTSHNTKYTSPALIQKVFVNMRKVGKGFSRVKTTLFASMLVQPQPHDAKEEDDEIPTAPTPPSPTNAPTPLADQDLTPIPHTTSPALPSQEQPITTSKSSVSLLHTLMETCATLSQKVVDLEQEKHTQALEILKLKKRVKKLEKKKKLRYSGFKRLRKEMIDQNVSAATKDVSTAEPTVFDDEEITMTMAQTLIKMKAEKAKILDEQITQRLHDEEIEKATAREKQEKDDLERDQVLQKQYEDKQENIDWNTAAEQSQKTHLDNIRKYQSLKRKPVSIAQARKNMIIYLKNMAGYKMKHFKGMTYDKVRPIFDREYKKVQTLFKPDKDVEEFKKKRVAEETVIHESFKKLKAVEVSGFDSTQETPSNDLKEISEKDVQNILEIVLIIKVGGITKAYQCFEDMLKCFDREDLVALWRLVKEKFSSAVPREDKEKALWVELTRLFEPSADDKKTLSAKQPKSKPAIKKSSKPLPASKPKETQEKPSKVSTAKPPKHKSAKEKSTKTTLPEQAGKGKTTKVHKAKSSFQLVDEPEEEPAHFEPELELEHQGEGDDDEMEHAIQMSLGTSLAEWLYENLLQRPPNHFQ